MMFRSTAFAVTAATVLLGASAASAGILCNASTPPGTICEASALSPQATILWNPPAGGGSFSSNFGDTDLQLDKSGNFTDTYDFFLPTGITSFTISSTATVLHGSTDLDFTSVTFNGVSFVKDLGGGKVEFQELDGPIPVVKDGPQELIVSGHVFTNPTSAAYDGVVSFSPAAVPEPSIWALMIVGFGGAGALLRRRRMGAVAA